jgi:uncharacterized protein YndB with AHSA1/START domain
MTTIGETTFTTTGERAIEITRVFDAPRGLVWEAMTSPDHVPHWLGPRGWTMPACEIDLREGGSWRYLLRGPDGAELGMRGTYREVAAPDRLVSTESFDGYPGESLNTVALTDEDGKTRVTVTVLYSSKEVRDGVIASGMQAGAAESYDRLAERLASGA